MPPAPQMSPYFNSLEAPPIRMAQFVYDERPDKEAVGLVNCAIGSITGRSLPPFLHRAIQVMGTTEDSTELAEGVLGYSGTQGLEGARKGMLRMIRLDGFDTDGLFAQITDGGSDAMELAIAGTCSKHHPLAVISPAYANYMGLANRLGIPVVSVNRTLQPDGQFTQPNLQEIEALLSRRIGKPGAMVVIPYDNPTGQFMPQEILNEIARLCVQHGVWMISDEAYRGMTRDPQNLSSIWGIGENTAPGIRARAVSIESLSKRFNNCGGHCGALITSSQPFHQQATRAGADTLCANVLGQRVAAALADPNLSDAEINAWRELERRYYNDIIPKAVAGVRERLRGAIVSEPESALYFVIDVAAMVPQGFDAKKFVIWCGAKGYVDMEGQKKTLLVAPMSGFYPQPRNLIEKVLARQLVNGPNLGRTQMRVACVRPPEEMAIMPELLRKLLEQYLTENGSLC